MTVMGHKGRSVLAGNTWTAWRIPNTRHPKPTLARAPPPNDYGGYTGSANHHHVYDNVLGVLLDGHDVATPVERLAVVAAIEAMHAKGRTQK